jgi:hypothetical protein
MHEATPPQTQSNSRLPDKCGLAQGSPLSLILFLLYLAEVLLQDTEHRFGYTDDLCIYSVRHARRKMRPNLAETYGRS